ncbi:porin family protein [Mucilaginibacter flavidus]|uniref:porin family protein n=1 Tax=Mucilaginibacter flavidus TaxID=2949309 RepID=UPI0020926D83|nr:porin family protein [Mucilaginibacter flavidus]MCO5946288.1 PorT family protein [Mucilaginibacter flavidus]
MKKLLFFTICLLVAGSVSAQGYYSGHRRAVRRSAPRSSASDFYRTRVGIAGGFNFADAVDAYNSNYSTAGITAFHVGLTLDIPVAYPLSFAPEVLYSQKGYAATTTDGNFTQRSNFIDVPLLAKFRLSPFFNFVVGPQVSFPISTTNTYDNGFNGTAQDHYSTTHDRTVLDGVIGVGVDINPNVEIRARYTIDFQQTDDNAYYIPGYRNEVFQLGIGFKFQ